MPIIIAAMHSMTRPTAAAELLIEEIESPRTALPEQRLIAGSFARGESIDIPHR